MAVVGIGDSARGHRRGGRLAAAGHNLMTSRALTRPTPAGNCSTKDGVSIEGVQHGDSRAGLAGLGSKLCDCVFDLAG